MVRQGKGTVCKKNILNYCQRNYIILIYQKLKLKMSAINEIYLNIPQKRGKRRKGGEGRGGWESLFTEKFEFLNVLYSL